MDWSSPPFYPLTPQSGTFYPLTPQSGTIPFSEWISLLTLCLAPIIAHVAAGVPQTTYLTRHHPRPRWHDYISHYNPCSIIWRYAAITDRRIRTRDWSPADMASANAIFWTPVGWDGSESIAAQSVHYATHLPSRGYTSILSWEFLKTAIVTLQGVQVMYLFAGGFAGQVRLPSFAVDMIAFPIAILGLLRLWPAFWVTDDFSFGYVARGGGTGTGFGAGMGAGEMSVKSRSSERFARIGGYDEERVREDVRRLLETPTAVEKGRIRGSEYWLSRVFRFAYVLPLVALWPIGVLTLLPGPWHRTGKLSMTAYVGALLSTVNLLIATAIYGYYAVRHGCRSTIIPCISAAWYKILTGLFWAAVLGLVVVSAIETRKTPCGKYTTVGKHMDEYYCPGLLTLDGGGSDFGVARWVDSEVMADTEKREFEVLSFSGSCQDVIGPSNGFYNVSK